MKQAQLQVSTREIDPIAIGTVVRVLRNYSQNNYYRMKTRIFLIAITAVVLLSCGQKVSKNASNPDATVKEIGESLVDMKSYYLEYKTMMAVDGIKSTSTAKHWFDLKNDKFVTETITETDMMGQVTKNRNLTISTDKGVYSIDLDNKTGIKMSNDDYEDDPINNIKSEDNETFRRLIESEGGKILGNEDFMGKSCILIELMSEGSKSKMWYYKGIPLKIEAQSYKMEATKFEEGVSIPDSKFDIPGGVTITEGPSM